MFIRAALAGALLALAAFLTPAVAVQPTPEAPETCAWSGPEKPGFLTCQAGDGRTETFRAPFDFDTGTVARARAGDPEARWLMAILYLQGEPDLNPKLHAEWLIKAAEAGDPRGMTVLGLAYMTGKTLPMDKAAGIRWIRAAADKDWPSAMGNLGYYYAVGDGLPKDAAESARWFRAAAEAGDADAMSNLAISYDLGFGVPRDRAEAARWRQRKAEMGLRASGPTEEEMLAAYPIEAAAAAIEMTVMLRCDLDGALFATKCRIETEEPAGWGFGEAALKLSPKVQMKPGLRPGTTVRVPVQFKLASGPEPRPVVDNCAAYAIALERSQAFSGAPQWWARYWQARSRLLARQAGEPEGLERLEPQVAAATAKLAKGKDRGLFGMVNRCSLG